MTTTSERFVRQLCRAALSHDLTILLFIRMPHKVRHKTLAARERIKCAVKCQPNYFLIQRVIQAALVWLHP